MSKYAVEDAAYKINRSSSRIQVFAGGEVIALSGNQFSNSKSMKIGF